MKGRIAIPATLRKHWFVLAIVAGFPLYSLLHSGPARSCSPLLPNLIPSAQAALPTAKEPAPVWQLTAIDGTTISSAAFVGKPIVLNFWGTWCPPCVAEVPDLIQLQRDFQSENLTVIGIASEPNPQAVRRFAANLSINYPIVLADKAVIEAFGVTVYPTTFFIGADGRIVTYAEGQLTPEQLRKGAEMITQ